MADKKGGNIIDTLAINTLIKQGEESQKACESHWPVRITVEPRYKNTIGTPKS